MILILSDCKDSSTTHVIEWLEYLNVTWLRINKEDKLKIEFNGNDIQFTINNLNSINLSEITGFWFRRGYFSIENTFSTKITQFDDLQREELKDFIQFIYYRLNKLKHINSVKNSNVNKLIVSDIARSLDLLTPNDLIFSNIKSLNKLLSKNPNPQISKVISGRCMQIFENFTIYNYTKIINIPSITNDSFFPSLVQNCIIKKYELRIFYLNGTFFSMAIFSQNDNQTNVDFRNYNYIRPNRTVPYKLPLSIENKLDLLMKKLDLNCGSIDMIVTHELKYFFLEVNPIGQFGMVSYPCNYNLEKEIAQYF